MHRTALVAAFLLCLPSIALGQEPGVTFDDGPSSKEYAIPLDEARGQTRSKAPKPKPEPAAREATPTQTMTERATSSSSPPREMTRTTEDDETETQAAAPTSTLPGPPDGGVALSTSRGDTSSADGPGAGLVIGGLAVAAVLLGGLAGLVIRRRRSPIDQH